MEYGGEAMRGSERRIGGLGGIQTILPLAPAPIIVAVPPHRPSLAPKLQRAALRILGLLGDYLPHDVNEVQQAGGKRYSARINELRAAGHPVLGPMKAPRHGIYETEPAGPGGLEMYRLDGRPVGQVPE